MHTSLGCTVFQLKKIEEPLRSLWAGKDNSESQHFQWWAQYRRDSYHWMSDNSIIILAFSVRYTSPFTIQHPNTTVITSGESTALQYAAPLWLFKGNAHSVIHAENFVGWSGVVFFKLNVIHSFILEDFGKWKLYISVFIFIICYHSLHC